MEKKRANGKITYNFGGTELNMKNSREIFAKQTLSARV